MCNAAESERDSRKDECCGRPQNEMPSVVSAVDDLEAKILQRVAAITLSDWGKKLSGDDEATTPEVSLLTEDESTETPTVFSEQSSFAMPSSAGSGSKRKSQRSTSEASHTPRVANQGIGTTPLRKKRRSQLLASAPRIPDSPTLDESRGRINPLAHIPYPSFSPFDIYDNRMDRLAASPKFPDHILTPVESSSRLASDNISPLPEESFQTPPIRMSALARRRAMREKKRKVPFFPNLDPEEEDDEQGPLSSLDSLALSLDTTFPSPIRPMLSPYREG